MNSEAKESDFADGVWVDDESILFKQDDKTEKNALGNVDELKSYYYPLGFLYNSKQSVVKIKFTEPIGMGGLEQGSGQTLKKISPGKT